MWVAALIAAAATVGSAIIGYTSQRASEEQARKLLQQARDEFGNIDLPKLEELAAAMMPPTELAKIRTNPEFARAQMAALDRLQEVSASGGMTLADQQAQAQAMSAANQSAAANRSALREDFAARGQLGSGAQLAMSMNANQDAAKRANQAGMGAAAAAQQRALDAIMQRGQMAGQMRGQEFGEKSKIAEAQDIVARYNAVGRNQAIAAARQQEFDNAAKKAAGMNGMTGQVAASYARDGQNAAKLAGAAGQATAQAAGAAYQYHQANQAQQPGFEPAPYPYSPPPLVQAETEEEEEQGARRFGV